MFNRSAFSQLRLELSSIKGVIAAGGDVRGAWGDRALIGKVV